MARPKWYQNKMYKEPFPEREIGNHPDISLVSSTEIDEHTLLVLRKWPNGETDRVRIMVDDKGVYSYDVAPKDRHGVAKEFIGDPDWHPPYVHSNAIPGDSPSSINKYHAGTAREYDSRKDLNDYFEQNNLALISRAEAANMHGKEPPPAKNIPAGRFTGNTPGKPQGASQSVVISDLNKV